jgi:hypothetical protein
VFVSHQGSYLGLRRCVNFGSGTTGLTLQFLPRVKQSEPEANDYLYSASNFGVRGDIPPSSVCLYDAMLTYFAQEELYLLSYEFKKWGLVL